jgi:hypothetical protein
MAIDQKIRPAERREAGPKFIMSPPSLRHLVLMNQRLAMPLDASIASLDGWLWNQPKDGIIGP